MLPEDLEFFERHLRPKRIVRQRAPPIVPFPLRCVAGFAEQIFKVSIPQKKRSLGEFVKLLVSGTVKVAHLDSFRG